MTPPTFDPAEPPPGDGLVAWIRVLGWLAVAGGVLTLFWAGVAALSSGLGPGLPWLVPGVQGVVGGSLLLACAAIVERLTWIAAATHRATAHDGPPS
jgi:hypothetical protein